MRHFILARLRRSISPPFLCAPAARSFPLILFFASAARDFPSGFLRIFARLQLAILPPCFFGGGWICRGAHMERTDDTACGACDWAVLALRVAKSVMCVDGLARTGAALGEDPLAGLGLPPRQPDRAQLATAITRISAGRSAFGVHLYARYCPRRLNTPKNVKKRFFTTPYAQRAKNGFVRTSAKKCKKTFFNVF